MDATSTIQCDCQKDKVVVIMEATSMRKLRLSIHLATLFPFSEIINSDKIQVYRGLDITTNKIPINEWNGVPHHLLGEIDLAKGEFTTSEFRRHTDVVISDIISRKKLPVVVGGSNFVHSRSFGDRFDPELNVFEGSLPSSSSISSVLRYKEQKPEVVLR